MYKAKDITGAINKISERLQQIKTLFLSDITKIEKTLNKSNLLKREAESALNNIYDLTQELTNNSILLKDIIRILQNKPT
jgi:sugar-specific transcriptional regulator TrmB